MSKFVTMSIERLSLFVNRIEAKKEKFDLFAPVAENNGFAFRKVEDDTRIALDYTRSYFSPVKEYLLPPCETVARFSCGNYYPAIDGGKKTVLFGVHPYDIKAMDVLDAVYMNGKTPDPGYMKRRENLIIIGMDILSPPKDSFCADVGAHTVDHGFDLMLTWIGDGKFVVEIGTEQGQKLLSMCFRKFTVSTESELAKRELSRVLTENMYTTGLPVPKENLAGLLDTEKGKAFLAESAKKCIACGNCTKVCPTCMCYTVHDTAELDGTSERIRARSSCLFGCSAQIAGGHNFRGNAEERIKNRLLDKTKFIAQEHGVFGCVGCGRCGICPVGIAHLASLFKSISDSEEK